MTRLARWTLSLLLSLALAACGPNASSTSGGSQRCQSDMRGGSCEGSIGAVRGPYTYAIEVGEELEGTPVFVTAEVTIGGGAMRLFLGDASRPSVESIVRPGAVAKVHGPAVVDAFGDINIGMFVIEVEEVTGVSYTITWEPQ